MFKPNGPRVLVSKIAEGGPKSSIIEVVSYTDEPSQFARVLAVGDGYKKAGGGYIPLDVLPGQLVVTKPYAGSPVTVEIDGAPIEAHLLMDEDVLMVIGE